MVRRDVGKTPNPQTGGRTTAQDIQDILAGKVVNTLPVRRKKKSPGRPVIVLPFLRIAVGGAAAPRAHVRKARARRSIFGGLLDLFGGPARRRSGRVLPFKKKTVRRR